jgi:hypothetical protein
MDHIAFSADNLEVLPEKGLPCRTTILPGLS